MTILSHSPDTSAQARRDPAVPCDWHGCDRTAEYAVRFVGSDDHVHDCAEHTAELRAGSYVTSVTQMPCPWPCGPTLYVAQPPGPGEPDE